MKLFHVSGKRTLQTFVHCRPIASDVMAPIKEATRDDSDEDGEMLEENEETFSVECVGFATHGPKWAASGGMDHTLKVWDLDNGALRCTCVHTTTVTHLIWHPTLPIVYTSTVGGVISLWDARAGLQLAEFTGHRAQITSFTLRSSVTTENGVMDVIVTACDDHTSRVYLVNSAGLL